jgi:hypothetical protein
MTFLKMAHRLSLFQSLAHRRYLGEDQPGHPPTPADSPEQGSSAQRWRGGFPVGQEYRSGRRGAWLRRRQEGKGLKSVTSWWTRRVSSSRQRSTVPRRDGSRGDQDPPKTRRHSIPTSLSSVAGGRLPRRGQGLGPEDPGLERISRGASQKG